MNLDAPDELVPEMPGYLYIFRDVGDHSNEIKVGYSKHPNKRVRELHTSGTVWPMQISTLWHVSNMRLAEKAAHAALEPHRINPRREFFEIAPRPHFSLDERHDDVTTDAILWHLVSVMDEVLYQSGVRVCWIDPDP